MNSQACVIASPAPSRAVPAADTAARNCSTTVSWPTSSPKTAPVGHSRTAGKLPVLSSVARGTGSGSSGRIRPWISRLSSAAGRVASSTT